VEHALQDVEVSFGGGIEEAASDELDAPLDTAGSARLCPRSVNDGRQVEDHPAKMTMSAEKLGHEGSLAPPDVDDALVGGQVQRLHYGGDHGGREHRHARVEQGGRSRILAEILEERHPAGVVERGLARPHGVQELAPGPPEPRRGEHEDRDPQRAGDVAAQGRAQRPQLEAAAVLLRHDAARGQRPQQPVERRFVAARLRGQERRGLGAVLEQVRDPQVGEDPESLGPPVARDLPQQLGRR
jgi:hypothetical protein